MRARPTPTLPCLELLSGTDQIGRHDATPGASETAIAASALDDQKLPKKTRPSLRAANHTPANYEKSQPRTHPHTHVLDKRSAEHQSNRHYDVPSNFPLLRPRES